MKYKSVVLDEKHGIGLYLWRLGSVYVFLFRCRDKKIPNIVVYRIGVQVDSFYQVKKVYGRFCKHYPSYVRLMHKDRKPNVWNGSPYSFFKGQKISPMKALMQDQAGHFQMSFGWIGWVIFIVLILVVLATVAAGFYLSYQLLCSIVVCR